MRLLFCLFFLLLAQLPARAGPDDLAVIIANKRYDYAHAVEYADRDGEAMRDFAERVLAIPRDRIIVVQDASLARLRTLFGTATRPGEIAGRLAGRKAQRVWIYYSGHGVPGKRADGGFEPYLLPKDANPQQPEHSAVPLDEIEAAVRAAVATHAKGAQTVLILDACFSGRSEADTAVADAKGRVLSPESSAGGPLRFTPRKASDELIVLAAARDDEIASWDREARHGLFTELLLQALYNGTGEGKSVTVGAIEKFLAGRTNERLAALFPAGGRLQRPELRGPRSGVLIDNAGTITRDEAARRQAMVQCNGLRHSPDAKAIGDFLASPLCARGCDAACRTALAERRSTLERETSECADLAQGLEALIKARQPKSVLEAALKDVPARCTAARAQVAAAIAALEPPPVPPKVSDTAAQPTGSAPSLPAPKAMDKQVTSWFERSIKGNVEANYQVGMAIWAGTQAAFDPALAIAYFKFAADRGHLLAMHELGGAFSQDAGQKRDLDKAAGWYLTAVKAGSAFTLEQMKRYWSVYPIEVRIAIQRRLVAMGHTRVAPSGSFDEHTLTALDAVAPDSATSRSPQTAPKVSDTAPKAAAVDPKRPAAVSDTARDIAPGSGAFFRDRLADGSDCAFCPKLVVVPAGEFAMGSTEAEIKTLIRTTKDEQPISERPKHTVSIAKAFAVGQHEVTFTAWDACVEAKGCTHVPDDGGMGRGEQPVVNVSWDDAKQFVDWLSAATGKQYRLLSEAEWEYAARANRKTMGSVQTDLEVWGAKRSGGRAQPVGTKRANRWGLHDMLGNVSEWVEDCWNGIYTGAPADGSAWVDGACTARVRRGGSFEDGPLRVRAASRIANSPDVRLPTVGFRVAREIDDPDVTRSLKKSGSLLPAPMNATAVPAETSIEPPKRPKAPAKSGGTNEQRPAVKKAAAHSEPLAKSTASCNSRFSYDTTCSQSLQTCNGARCNEAHQVCMRTGRWIYRRDDGSCTDWGMRQRL